MLKPTKQAYNELQKAYDFFNYELFRGKLPACLITMQRNKATLGYFSGERWANREGEITDEIAMNPMFFKGRTIEQTLSTLVHEMVHLWQKNFGSPGRGRYHNKEWADKMESIGLMPSDTKKPEGKKTGDQMSHYVIKDGLFAKRHARLVARGFTISWTDRNWKHEGGEGVGKDKSKNTRQRYHCPKCNIKAWARPGLYLICGKCKKKLKGY